MPAGIVRSSIASSVWLDDSPRCGGRDRTVVSPGLTRERALAGAVRLLDLGFFRIGSETYTEENGSYGLATIRRAHVRVRGDEVRFDFSAKGGQRRIRTIEDQPSPA